MGGWLAIRPVGEWVFRIPSPLEAGVHGPGVARGSLSYPPPSTVAGFLAFQSCRGSPGRAWNREYDDVRECLKRLAGGNSVTLRMGLAWVEGEYHLYVGARRLPRLSTVLEKLSDLAAKASKSVGLLGLEAARAYEDLVSSGWGPGRGVRTGISLRRGYKSVVEGMMYSVEELSWLGGEVLVYTEPVVDVGGRVIGKFGGEGGVAVVETVEMEGRTYAGLAGRGDGDKAVAMLVTPALIDLTDTYPLSGVVNPYEERVSEGLGKALFGRYNECGYAKLIYTPKAGELSLSVYSMGWSMARSRPRKPHLVVPPGSVVLVEGGRGCLERAASEGVGSHSDLGWGSIVYSYPP